MCIRDSRILGPFLLAHLRFGPFVSLSRPSPFMLLSFYTDLVTKPIVLSSDGIDCSWAYLCRALCDSLKPVGQVILQPGLYEVQIYTCRAITFNERFLRRLIALLRLTTSSPDRRHPQSLPQKMAAIPVQRGVRYWNHGQAPSLLISRTS